MTPEIEEAEKQAKESNENYLKLTGWTQREDGKWAGGMVPKDYEGFSYPIGQAVHIQQNAFRVQKIEQEHDSNFQKILALAKSVHAQQPGNATLEMVFANVLMNLVQTGQVPQADIPRYADRLNEQNESGEAPEEAPLIVNVIDVNNEGGGGDRAV